MHRQEMVNIGQSRLDAACEGFIIRRAQEWIKPDQTMTIPFQARHLAPQEIDVAAIPAIANDEHHCPSTQHPPAPFVIKGLQRFTNTRAARPIVDDQSYVFQRLVKIADLKRSRDTS